MTALKTGNYDPFIKQLEDYKNMSEDEAAEAFKKYGLEKEDAVKLLGKMDEIISNAKQTKKNYEEVAENFPNPFDPQQYASSSTRYKAAALSYKAWEKAQETLVFSKDLYNNYNERVVKMANTFSSISNAIGKTDAQKFMVLLNPNDTALELEILQNEIKSLDDNIPEQKKLKAKKQRIREDLLEFSIGMSNIKDAHARKDTLENIDKLHNDSKALFNKYVNNISDKNNTIVFDTQVDEAYDLIKDSHLMNNEMKGISRTINILNNPKGFLNLQERFTIAENLINKDIEETLLKNLDIFSAFETTNDAINEVHKQTGLRIPEEYKIAFDEAKEKKQTLPMPTYFIDPITGDRVINGDKFDLARRLWSIYLAITQDKIIPKEEIKTDVEEVDTFDINNSKTFPKKLIDDLTFTLNELISNEDIDSNTQFEDYIVTDMDAIELIKNYASNLKKEALKKKTLSFDEYLGIPLAELKEQLKELFEEVLIKPELMSKIYNIQQAIRFLTLAELSSTITPQQAEALFKLEDAKSKMDKNGDFYELEGKKLDTRVTKIVDEILNKEYGLKGYNYADELGIEISNAYKTLLKAPDNKTATAKELVAKLKEKGKVIKEFQLRFNTNKLNKIEEGLEKDRSLENFKVLLNEYAYKETSIRGNTIDELGRQFLSGEELKKTDKITDKAFEDLFLILVEFQKNIEEKGEIILARNLRVNGTTTDSKTFGGEMDILVITKEGKFKIYDMKTARNWSNFGNEKDGFYKKEKYGLQLSIYKNALENLLGIQVDLIELLPIQTIEDLDGNITSVKRVNNPEIKKLNYADYKEIVEKYVPSKMDTTTLTIVTSFVQELYNSIPELAKLGTVEQYATYLNTIFPNSKLKDILYHGSRNADRFDNFDDNLIGELDTGFFGKGIYFSADAKYAQGYANQAIDKKGQLYAVIVNLQDPLNTDANQANKNWGTDVIKNHDGALVTQGAWSNPEINGEEPVGYNPNELFEIVVKSSSQTHILGSKQDIKGFEKFTTQSSTDGSTKTETNQKKVADLRAQEREELAAKIPNIEEYEVDGKIRKSLIKDRKDYQTYVDIYKKYDELISPLLENEPKKETVSPYDKIGDYYISIPIERDGVESIIVENKKGKGALYEIITDKNGSVIGLIPKNKPEQIITNEKLLVAVEIQRNKFAFDAVSKIEKLSETVVKSKKEIPVTKILENVLNYDLTEKIANDIDSLYDNKKLDKEALISIQLWVNNTATRLNSLLREKEYENDPKLTRSWENMFIINELVSEKLNLINEKENKLNQKELVVKKVKSKSVAQLQKIRDEELKTIQETRKKLNIEFDPLDDLPQNVSTTMERFDNKLPIDIVALDEASAWIYAKYKEISNMELDPFRLLTLKQIKSYKKTLEKDLIAIEKYKTTNYEKSILQDEAFESTDTNRTSDRERTKETKPSKQTNFDEPIKRRVKKYREKRIKTLKTSVEKNKNIEIINTDPTEVVETEPVIPEVLQEEKPITKEIETPVLEESNIPKAQTVEEFNQLSIIEKFDIITKELEEGKVLTGTYYRASNVKERKDLYTDMPDKLSQEVLLDDGRILQTITNDKQTSAPRVTLKAVDILVQDVIIPSLSVEADGKHVTYIRKNPINWDPNRNKKPIIKDLSLEDINKDINLKSLAFAKDKNYEVVYESVTKPEYNGRYMIKSISKNYVTLKGLSKSVVVKTKEIKDKIKEVVNNKIIPSSPVDTETIIKNIDTVKKNDIVIDDTLTDIEQALKIINDKLC